MKSFWIFLLKNKSFTYLVMTTLVLAGLFSVYVIPKESSPEVVIPVGIVTTVLRGGSGEDVEKLITNKLEQEIANVENIDKVTSTSRDGISVISAQFLAKADVNQSIQNLKDAVDRVKGQLPADADEPQVLKVNFSDQPIMFISISQDLSPIELTALGEDLKEELKKVKGVSKVEVTGTRERQVQVIVHKDKLVRYGLSPDRVVSALQASNASFPIGKITVDNIEYPIKFSGSIENGNEVENISFLGNDGTVIYLRDIATISDGLENPKTISRISTLGNPSESSLTLAIYKKSGGDITEIGQAVKDKIESLKNDKLLGAQVVVSLDAAKQVSKDLRELSRTGLETIILVMIVLFLTLGWRESVVAGLSIPLSFVIAFIGLLYSGNTINFLSLFSLILAIGILVDSGIVVAESIHARNKDGDVEKASIETINEYAWPLIAGTMTTVAVFAPLFFLSGIVGQFVKSIPFTLIFVLLASIFVALGLVPIIATLLIKKNTEETKLAKLQEEYFHLSQEWYKKFLTSILLDKSKQKKFFWILVGGFVLSFGLLFTGFIKVELFPQDDQEFVIISIEKQEGSTLSQTDIVTRQVEEVLYEQTFVKSFVTTTGASSALVDNSGGTGNSKFANITVMLLEKEERDNFTSTQAVTELRKSLANIKDATIKVGQSSNGPPSGKPVVIKFLGEDLNELAILADKAETILNEIDGTQDVETSLRDDGTQFEFVVDKNKATLAGLTPIQIAGALRTAVSGSVATTIKKQNNDIDILVRVGLNDKFVNPEDTTNTTIETVKNIELQTQRGGVLLGTVVDVKLTPSRSVISHEKEKRVVSVSSELKEGKTATEIVNAFQAREKELGLTNKVQINYGGETEDIDNTFRDMLIALVAGMVLMLAILVLEFNSFRYSVYLLSAIPLSLIGVFLGLFITGKALSFSAMLGIIALAGVIINHAIILLDSIIHRLDKETDVNEENVLLKAIVESSAVRLRPIILTTVTTVVGMIPLANVSALWGPLAITIMFGLLFSMVLTLIFIPLRFYKKPGARYIHLKK
jgi:multidrug efflux pump subunit AcrB